MVCETFYKDCADSSVVLKKRAERTDTKGELSGFTGKSGDSQGNLACPSPVLYIAPMAKRNEGTRSRGTEIE